MEVMVMDPAASGCSSTWMAKAGPGRAPLALMSAPLWHESMRTMVSAAFARATVARSSDTGKREPFMCRLAPSPCPE